MAHAIPGDGRADAGLGAVLNAVKREFDEMPGLALTVDQAQRLWSLEPRTCTVVLSRLVESGYLCQTGSGQYARPSAA
jgi:predicted transcriptional regulator of viral defense system